jgi:hypothetical protein
MPSPVYILKVNSQDVAMLDSLTTKANVTLSLNAGIQYWSIVYQVGSVQVSTSLGSFYACEVSSPSTPLLLLPLNGTMVTSTTIEFEWNHADWGNVCGISTNSFFYELYAFPAGSAPIKVDGLSKIDCFYLLFVFILHSFFLKFLPLKRVFSFLQVLFPTTSFTNMKFVQLEHWGRDQFREPITSFLVKTFLHPLPLIFDLIQIILNALLVLFFPL